MLKSIENICYCRDIKMSWLEHFPKFNNCWGGGGGIRMSWVENFRKTNNRGDAY